jgi:hypothetical protein
MNHLYPEPPHLMIAVYSEKSEVETFASAAAAIEAQGENPPESSKWFGLVILEYLLNEPGDRHPIAVATSAEALGLPIELWTDDGIGVECGLPTPTELRAGRVNFPTELYVSRALLGRDAFAASRLEVAYGDGAAVTRESCAALGEMLQSADVAE